MLYEVITDAEMSAASQTRARPGQPARKARRQILLGGGVLAALALAAIFAPLIAPYDPESMSVRDVMVV